MQFSELVTEVRYYLDEFTDAGLTHWSDVRIKAWINEGVGDVATRLPATVQPKLGTTWTKHLSSGTYEYTFDQEYLKIDFVGLDYVPPTNGNTYRFARVVDRTSFNILDDNIYLTPTTSRPVVAIHGQKIAIKPTPTILVNNGMKVWFVKPPTDMTEDADVPEIPQFAHRWPILYAVFKALKEDNDQRANDIYAEYMAKFEPWVIKSPKNREA